MQSKRILFIGGNYYPEPTGIGKYNGEMIELLATLGYQCTVITSFPYYPHWKIQEPYEKSAYRYKKELHYTSANSSNPIEIYRCPQYVPHRPTGKNRMMLDFSFLITSFFKIIQLIFRKRYDIIITVVPCFLNGLLGIFYQKLKKAKFIYHIQDLQIDAAQELNLINSKVIIGLLFRIEKCILMNADIVSSISAGMIRKIKNKCKREVVLFPNWVDTKSFYPISENARLKEEYNFKSTDKIILYSGAIGEKQGLESIIHAAEVLGVIHELKFVICGSGPYKQKLLKMKEDMKLNNLFFLPLQAKENMNRFLNMADVHLVLQKSNASDLVMPSKLTTIFSVGGLAIVAADANSSLYNLVSSHEMGVVIEPDNHSALVRAIDAAVKSNYDAIKRNARIYAEQYLSVDSVFSGYLKQIQ